MAAEDVKREDEAYATRDDVSELLENFKAELTEANTQATNRTVGNLMRKFDERLQARFNKLESDHSELAARVAALEASFRHQASLLTQTNKEIATFSKEDPEKAAQDDSWERKPDSTILKLSAAAHVTKTAIADTLTEWLKEAGCDTDDKVSVEGPQLGRNFVLQFKGANVLAARRAKKAHSLLRLPDGSWRSHSVNAPSGESIDLFVGIDKNTKQQHTERGGKRLLKHLEAKYPTQNFGFIRREGMVTWDWQPLARALPHHDGHCDVEWNNLVTDKGANVCTFDRPAANAAVASSASFSSAGVQWSL